MKTIALFVFLFGFALSATPPVLPQRFFAQIYLSNLQINQSGLGNMVYSVPQKYVSYELPIVFLNETLTAYSFENENNTYTLLSGICFPPSPKPKPFSDYFSWIKYSTFEGSVTLHPPVGPSVTCDQWVLNAQSSKLSLCVTQGSDDLSLPTFFEVVAGNVTSVQMWYFNVDPQESDVPTPLPAICAPDYVGTLCPGGNVETLNWLRLHSPSDYTLDNKNLADWVGQAAFSCASLLKNLYPEYTLVSMVMVEMNTSYGLYQHCDDVHCLGGNPQAVGREVSFGILPDSGGQCDMDPKYGSWISLNAVSGCGNNLVGTNGCVWREVQLIKTVTVKCLESLGLLEKCAADKYRLPMSQTVALFHRAFAYSAADGGCDPVYPSDMQIAQ